MQWLSRIAAQGLQRIGAMSLAPFAQRLTLAAQIGGRLSRCRGPSGRYGGGMSVVFRAADEPAATRTDYWQHVVGEALCPIEVRTPAGLDARDRLHVGHAGAVGVVEVSMNTSHMVERGRAHIRQLDPERYTIDVQTHGRGMVEQDGRQALLAPGDLTFVDSSRPCRWAYSCAKNVALVFPRGLLPLRQDELSRLTGVRIRGDRGIGALVSSLARQLPAHVDDGGAAGQARLGTAVLDLVTAALAARLDRAHEVPPESRQRALLRQVLAFIETRLDDPALSPAGIAAAHHVSVRYLYKLFETEQATVAGWIRRRRLERCRSDLLDPAHRHTPVVSIAERWGFRNAAHFSRSFRAAYGLPPVEYRAISQRARVHADARRPG
jgi:AraC-like DNA-binding protein